MLGSSLLQFIDMHIGLIPACYRQTSARALNQKLLIPFRYYWQVFFFLQQISKCLETQSWVSVPV